MKKASQVQVQFQPTGKRIRVAPGSNLLDAARSAGIEISSDCGGEGNCGQCQLVVLSGEVSAPGIDEGFALSQFDLRSGRRLACCTHVQGDTVVEIPRDSMITGQRLQIDSSLAGITVDPLVRAYHLSLTKPTVTDFRSDFTRVADAVRLEDPSLPGLHAHPAVLRGLSDSLRKNGWQVTAFVRGAELVGLGRFADRACGVCIDLGTTKIAASLVDLQSGELLCSSGAPNPQMGYGEDVISRMNYVQRSPDGARILAEKVQNTLRELLGELVAQAGITADQVVEGVVVGNTAMIHLLVGLPIRPLAAAPYVAVISDPLEIRAGEIGLEMAAGAFIYIPPCIGGFVGSDHIAMILACDLDLSERVMLGIDIGTNTEIVIRKPGRAFLSSASCASGPAFEGAHITEGMRAASGAIDKVKLTGGGVDWVTIQNEPPVGICGSGIIDTISELHRTGLINRQGGFLRVDGRVRQGKNGGEFLLVPAARSGTGRDIAIDQKDINEIQLAKGAIHAGLQILLEVSETPPEAVDEVIIAGAFGYYLNIQHAVDIGLFPRLPNARFRQVGNAALTGARWMLVSRLARERALQIQRATHHQALNTYPRFNRIFAQGMLFPEI